MSMKPEAKGVRVAFEGEGAKDDLFDRVLVSVGRVPNSKIPVSSARRYRVDQRSFIMVDEQRRTHEPSIFAIGDVVGEPMLAHKASHEGRGGRSDNGENVAFPARHSGGRLTDPSSRRPVSPRHRRRKEIAGHDREISVGRIRPGHHARSDGRPPADPDPESERLLGVKGSSVLAPAN
jgi:dihydrolipoamide dehydrogenase